MDENQQEQQEQQKKKSFFQKAKDEAKGIVKDEASGLKTKIEQDAKRESFHRFGFSSTGSVKEDIKRQGMNKLKEFIRKKLTGH